MANVPSSDSPRLPVVSAPKSRQEEFLDRLEPVPIDSVCSNSPKCPYCWKPHGEPDEGLDNAEQPVRFVCGHVYGEHCAKHIMFPLPQHTQTELQPLTFEPGSRGDDLGCLLSRFCLVTSPIHQHKHSLRFMKNLCHELLRGNAIRSMSIMGRFWSGVILFILNRPNELLSVEFFENAVVYNAIEKSGKADFQTSQEPFEQLEMDKETLLELQPADEKFLLLQQTLLFAAHEKAQIKRRRELEKQYESRVEAVSQALAQVHVAYLQLGKADAQSRPAKRSKTEPAETKYTNPSSGHSKKLCGRALYLSKIMHVEDLHLNHCDFPFPPALLSYSEDKDGAEDVSENDNVSEDSEEFAGIFLIKRSYENFTDVQPGPLKTIGWRKEVAATNYCPLCRTILFVKDRQAGSPGSDI
ncbi:hypothetical protein EJ04DRAFT_557409 [Polyplosphaeria fusca]|uniref:Uncharacterized protein n=1 Tax=Polyplosphaeria fusca TaxID=682080 RepID=A0A9P4QJ43_9PLEO|nr:hypothetical protein EJ04DRAFT_557409 [Polyplosphaeria fusca]